MYLQAFLDMLSEVMAYSQYTFYFTKKLQNHRSLNAGNHASELWMDYSVPLQRR